MLELKWTKPSKYLITSHYKKFNQKGSIYMTAVTL